MIELAELKKTCEVCPAQWEGKTTDGKPVYIRYRWGYLSVCVGEIEDKNGVFGEEVVGLTYGNHLDGDLSEEELFRLIKKEVVMSKAMEDGKK